ncbi:MAG: hypothetical protein PF693_21530 [Spirochaetia bacterium]|jgi:hypothetical protein|nr:hypothetical protein [Spirochaetia bacterium]
MKSKGDYSKERKLLLNNGLKYCYKCKEVKNINLFYKDSSQADGYEYKCKKCKKDYDKERHIKNWGNEEKKEELKLRNKKQFQKHKKMRNEFHCEYKKKRKLEDPVFKLRENISTNLRMFAKSNKRKSVFKYIGFSKEEFWEKMEKTIPIGYSKIDFLNGELWIDHIIPQSMYDYTVQGEIEKAFNPRNLRLIPKEENMKKHNFFDIELIKLEKIEDLLPEGVFINNV